MTTTTTSTVGDLSASVSGIWASTVGDLSASVSEKGGNTMTYVVPNDPADPQAAALELIV
jgi:hypothetical protein